MVGFCFGSPSWTRTNDTAVNSRVLYRLSYGGILKPTKQSLIGYLCRHRPIFPGRFQPSIFGTNELNYRVRNGNGWTLTLINTNCVSGLPGKHTDYKLFSALCQERLVTRTGFEPMLTAWEAAVLTTWPTGHGAPSRTRTGDPLIKSQLLYQLS